MKGKKEIEAELEYAKEQWKYAKEQWEYNPKSIYWAAIYWAGYKNALRWVLEQHIADKGK